MKIIGICMVLCFLQNCETEDRVNRTYSLENGTLHEIKMDFYSYGIFQQTRHIIGKGVIFEGYSDNDTGKGIAAKGALGADSVIVIFDSSKIITYTNISLENRINIQPSSRNILLNDAYEVITNELYRFTFKEADYENAEEIGG
ncbi:hypothetical protein JMN32_10090 [Fulvivirga sp. 29W222]|uniref:Uncharacterized protein n=1 Tax=Fulvivirga marina TaxID=2494733 RepID=A0A937FX64_9BACT|nr:hypothetical protein [Fulvivirga marina]MBL6446662.1 hypothetical protein [Fulvivirga marina]